MMRREPSRRRRAGIRGLCYGPAIPLKAGAGAPGQLGKN
jgi:hypothetical protein